MSRLSYDVFLDAALDDPEPPAAFVALDLVLDDGSRLSETAPVDAHGTALTARAQGGSRILLPGQWNRVACDLGHLAGRTVTRLVVAVDAPAAGRVWLDDVAIAPLAPATDPVDLVDTRRGSNSAFLLSRGNTYPGAARPNGALIVSPMTNRALDWFYAWSAHDTDSGRPALEGIALTNQPSPWMGDRNQLILTPTWGSTGAPHTFTHAAEEARPHRYAVRLDDGPLVEMTPTTHGAILRLTTPGTPGRLVLTQGVAEGASRFTRRTDGLWVGWVDNGSALSEGRSRLFVAIAFDVDSRPEGDAGMLLSAGPGERVCARIGTSLISVDQAVHVLRDELDADFDAVQADARAAWSERLGVLGLEGASRDEQISAYSSLYRVNLFPNFSDELVDGERVHASPVLPHLCGSDDERTGAQVVPGRMAVNNGFWDTYRTAWPLYALAYPAEGAALADGFVAQYRSGGWIARWSSPGYADLMTGTSSDVAFADLDAKGGPLPDRHAVYRAGLRNATARPTEAGVGRKDLRWVYRGVPTPDSHEPVSWAFEASLNDHALGLMAARLADDPSLDGRAARRLRDESAYLLGRASGYVNLFDEATGFFQSVHLDGSFRTPADAYDPREWGGDYTEANGWSFAFPAPHDVAGLAHLVGGREALRERLDTFFATVEDGSLPGTYPGHMHEITEAHLTRAGQFAVSNQPVHHIPFLYAFTSTPWRVGEVVHDALRRLFRGSDLGQGYPATRTTARCRPGTCSRCRASTRCRWAPPGTPCTPRTCRWCGGGSPEATSSSGQWARARASGPSPSTGRRSGVPGSTTANWSAVTRSSSRSAPSPPTGASGRTRPPRPTRRGAPRRAAGWTSGRERDSPPLAGSIPPR
nr:glycoside hydrolase domain-containing protein [Tessaracoccus coleopterorum]